MLKLCSCLVLVFACVACGSSFTAHEGGPANGGQSSAAGGSDTGNGGDPSSSGGTSSDGGSSPGGNSNTGGVNATGGGPSKGGSGGTATEDPCVRLKQQYETALEKARVCDLGSSDQCSPSSTVEPLGCGCPVLVNARSGSTTAAKKARQAYLDAKCGEGTVCPTFAACAQPVSASCAPATMAATTFVCTAGAAIAN
jgi:hypothetical protein